MKLSKLTERDDIEAYQTTFERIMVVHGIDRSRWAYKLAPEFTGKAQLAYAAMDTAASRDYEELKAAILRRYDINEETYRQRLRAASRKDVETHRELATRLADTVDKWTRECSSVQELRDLIVKEQLLNSLPSDIRVWVSERKPKTSREAGQLADDYLQARRRSQELSRNEQPRRLEKRPHGPIPVADLGGVRGVQMHPPLAASNVFCVHNCTSLSNDYAAVACSNNNQAQLHTHVSVPY